MLKSFRGGFESREPPLQPSIRGVEPPTSADWKGRNRRTRSIRPRAFLSGARRSGAAITRSLLNLFRATDATGRGSRPEVRSGPGTPARRITSPGLQLAYSSGTTTARASLARVSARRRSRARHATGRPHGLPHRSAKWGSHGAALWRLPSPGMTPPSRRRPLAELPTTRVDAGRIACACGTSDRQPQARAGQRLPPGQDVPRGHGVKGRPRPRDRFHPLGGDGRHRGRPRELNGRAERRLALAGGA